MLVLDLHRLQDGEWLHRLAVEQQVDRCAVVTVIFTHCV